MTGFDLSEKMLAKAASMTTDPDITWLRADLETLQLPAAQSDVIYSSLALHYLRDIRHCLPRCFRRWSRAAV